MRRASFRQLKVWEKSFLLCPELYAITERFPDSEKFGMIAQIKSAALSVPSNIAEGHGRSSDADFVRFLYMSLGSVRELETLIELSIQLKFLEDGKEILAKLNELDRMLMGLISKLRAS